MSLPGASFSRATAAVTPRSDLYALGCVLHELLTGEHLFAGDNEFALMQQHVSSTPTPVRTRRPDAPEQAEQLILDLLAKAPEDRPTDAYAVYQRLLHHDLELVYGPEHDDTREIADILTRLHLAAPDHGVADNLGSLVTWDIA